jgi:PRTRC genetic system ThiF family protein
MNTPIAVHITDNHLINPPNPITVNLVGAGGTGSQMLTALARMVTVFDDDHVSEANLGRQLFAETEVGFYKSVVLVNRINRFFGTNWKAIDHRFADGIRDDNRAKANLYISCVDTAAARFNISEMLYNLEKSQRYDRARPLYWMDMGNSRYTGQVILSTIGSIKQPESELYKPVGRLPFITEMFRDQLEQADRADDTPSCSLAEALMKQDLFINSAVANLGASLLWQLFREGMIFNRGMFINLKTFITQPLKVA